MRRPLAIASNNGDIAGGEVMLFRIAEAARDLGVDVTVVAPAEPGDVVESARARGLRAVEIKASGRAAYLAGLRRWDAAERRGVLWCNGLVPSFATAGRRDRIVHLHQPPRSRAQRLALHLALKSAIAVLVPSHDMARDMPISRAMPNWTDPLLVSKSRKGGTSPSVTLGFLGRHSTDKGLHVLAEAVSLLDAQNPGRFRLLLAGDPRSVSAGEYAVVDQALRRIERVLTRAGWIARESFFSQVDLAVFPSVWAEPFGLVVAEAMSAQIPFVISDAGALREVAGFSYPWTARAGDAHALAAAIRAACESHAERESAVEASHARWAAEYSPVAGRRRLARVLADVGVLDQGADT